MVRTSLIISSLFIGFCIIVSGLIWYSPQTFSNWWHSWQNTGMDTYLYYADTDPVMALPDTNLAQLASSTEALADSLMELAPYFTSSDYTRIKNNLYPTDFLATLPHTEQARRDFIKTPDPNQATNYHKQLQTSLAAYRKDLNGLRTVLETGYPSIIFNFFDGALKNKDLITQLTQIDTHVQNLQHLDQQRFACLDTYTNSCQYLSTIKRPHKTSFSDEVDVSILETSELAANHNYVDSYHFSSSTKKQLPAIIPDSRCYLQEKPAVYAWGLDTSRTSQLPMIKSTIINELYFYDLDKLTNENDYFKYLATTSKDRYSLQPTNPYMCFRFDDDLHRILTNNHIFTQLQKTDFSQWRLPSQLKKEIASIRNTNTYLPASDIENFLVKLQTNDLAQLTSTQTKKVNSWKLSARSNSAGLVHILGLVDDMMHTNIHVLPHRKQELLPFFLYRSYIPALYLFANQTVTPTEVTLLGERQPVSLEQFDLSTTTDIYTEYTAGN